jgi:hypothetical protein
MEGYVMRLYLLGVSGLVLSGSFTYSEAAGGFDGTYTGDQKISITDNSAACGRSDGASRTITVVDNRFEITWAGNKLDVNINADGSFKSTAVRSQTTSTVRTIVISGKISGGVLVSDFGHEKCAVRMTLRKA